MRLRVLDILGRQIAVLMNEAPGYHTFDFDATQHPSGIYVYQLQWNGRVRSEKMILLK